MWRCLRSKDSEVEGQRGSGAEGPCWYLSRGLLLPVLTAFLPEQLHFSVLCMEIPSQIYGMAVWREGNEWDKKGGYFAAFKKKSKTTCVVSEYFNLFHLAKFACYEQTGGHSRAW